MKSRRRRRAGRACALGAAVALVLGACDSAGRPDDRSAVPSPEPLPAAAPGTGDAPAVRGPDPAAEVAAAQRESARALANLLLAWDTADLRYAPGHEDALRGAYCIGGLRPCDGDEQSWDHLAVVNGYQLEALHEDVDSAAYAVVHDEVGIVWLGGMEYTQGSPPVTIALRRMDGLWRIVSVQPPLRPHLAPAALLRRYAGVQPDSAVLARWVAGRE